MSESRQVAVDFRHIYCVKGTYRHNDDAHQYGKPKKNMSKVNTRCSTAGNRYHRPLFHCQKEEEKKNVGKLSRAQITRSSVLLFAVIPFVRNET